MLTQWFAAESEYLIVAGIGLFGGVLLGLSARLGRFCTMGAIEDWLYGLDDLRLRMWGIAIGVAILGTFGLIATGQLDPAQTVYLSLAWSPLASVLGGLVLATISGPLAYLRVLAFPTRPAEGALLGIAQSFGAWTGQPVTLIGLAIGALVILVALSSARFRAAPSMIFWGALPGLAVVSAWWGTQWMASTGFEGTPVVAHTFAAPLGEAIMYSMTASGRSLSFGVGSVVGVWIGAFAGSLIKGHFRWEACEDPRELRRQILGAALMGVGAVVAIGCSIGQGLSAFSVLAWSAPVTVLAIIAGAALGLRQLIEGFAPAE